MSKATLCWWNDRPDATARLAALVEQAAAAGRIKRRVNKATGKPAASPCPSQFGWHLAVRVFERLVWHANDKQGLLVWVGPDTLARYLGCEPDTAASVLAWWHRVGLLEDSGLRGRAGNRKRVMRLDLLGYEGTVYRPAVGGDISGSGGEISQVTGGRYLSTGGEISTPELSKELGTELTLTRSNGFGSAVQQAGASALISKKETQGAGLCPELHRRASKAAKAGRLHSTGDLHGAIAEVANWVPLMRRDSPGDDLDTVALAALARATGDSKVAPQPQRLQAVLAQYALPLAAAGG